MMKALLALGVIALIANTAMPFYVDTYFYDTGNLIEEMRWEQIEISDYDDQDLVPVVGLEVTVPEKRVHDIAPYDYDVFIQMFWENRSSGEFYIYTIEVSGQWLDTVPRLERVKDGYGDYYDTVCFRSQMDSFFTITVEENDAEPIMVDGELGGDLMNFVELGSERIINTKADLNLTISGIPALGGDLPTDIFYNAHIRTFPDPDLPQNPTVGERVYQNEENLAVGKNGTIVVVESDEWWARQVYNWSIDRAAIICGYEAVEVNITSPLFGGWAPYREEVWVSNNASYPIKSWNYVNSSFEGENETFWFVVSQIKKMHDNGFVRGDQAIPWKTSPTSFSQVHELAEFSSWKPHYMPTTGDIEQSSFHISTEDAVAFAIENSVNGSNEDIANLRDWLDKYDPGRTGQDRVTIQDGSYYVEKDADIAKSGTHFWNLTFGYKYTDEELDAVYEEYDETGKRNATWAYTICVAQPVEWRPIQGKYEYGDMYIHYEQCRNWSAAYFAAYQLEDQLLTLESSEDILMSYEDLKDLLVLDEDGKIVWEEDDWYGYVIGYDEEDPWTTMLNTMTGFEMPTFKTGWGFMQSNVWASGQSVSGSVDTRDGRMAHYLVSEGTTLSLLFG